MTKWRNRYFFGVRIAQHWSSYQLHLKWWVWGSDCFVVKGIPWKSFGICKFFDFLSYYSDSSFITCIEFHHHTFEIFAIKLSGDCYNGGCFSCSRRTIEEQVGKVSFVDEGLDYMIDVVRVSRMAWWEMSWFRWEGRYFSTHGKFWLFLFLSEFFTSSSIPAKYIY